jgi:hypothetical protein
MMWAEVFPVDYSAAGALPWRGESAGPDTISAIFEDRSAAEAAIIEMRQLGIRPGDISLISRDGPVHVNGLAQESLDDSGLTFTAALELPNDEDLPTTLGHMTGKDAPPDSGNDPVRRGDASARADLDIYTDFPDIPGGINPRSPAAPRAAPAATEQTAVDMREERAHSIVAGAGLGSLAGLLLGVTSLAVPGIGPIIAAGPLATALGSMLAGGAAGGIIGALSTSGVPHEYARRYAASIEKGQTLVTVRTDPLSLDAVERALVANGGNEVYC